jgi:hypothetical protein
MNEVDHEIARYRQFICIGKAVADERQGTCETVQRAVRHGVLGSRPSSQLLLQIPAQSALSIMGAIELFLTTSVIQTTICGVAES